MATQGLQGIDQVMANLNKELVKLKGDKAIRAFIRSAIRVRQQMAKNPPKVPVDLANLDHSWFVATSKQTKGEGAKFEGSDAGVMSAEHKQVISNEKTVVLGAKQPLMSMGFSANYAAFVHEMINADFQRPKKVGGKMRKRRAGAGAKFFEAALNACTQDIVKIFQEEAKV
jgi:hypothetical protein